MSAQDRAATLALRVCAVAIPVAVYEVNDQLKLFCFEAQAKSERLTSGKIRSLIEQSMPSGGIITTTDQLCAIVDAVIAEFREDLAIPEEDQFNDLLGEADFWLSIEGKLDQAKFMQWFESVLPVKSKAPDMFHVAQAKLKSRSSLHDRLQVMRALAKRRATSVYVDAVIAQYFHRYDLDESGLIDNEDEFTQLATNVFYGVQVKAAQGGDSEGRELGSTSEKLRGDMARLEGLIKVKGKEVAASPMDLKKFIAWWKSEFPC